MKTRTFCLAVLLFGACGADMDSSASAGTSPVDAGAPGQAASDCQSPDAEVEAPELMAEPGRVRDDGESFTDSLGNTFRVPYLVDTETNQHCSIRLAADGSYRCLPIARASNVGSLFAEDACLEPLFLSDSPEGSFNYLKRVEPDGREHIFAKGGVHSGAVYAQDEGGACRLTERQPDAEYILFAAEYPPDSYEAFDPRP